jgi:hypothetical protein
MSRAEHAKRPSCTMCHPREKGNQAINAYGREEDGLRSSIVCILGACEPLRSKVDEETSMIIRILYLLIQWQT